MKPRAVFGDAVAVASLGPVVLLESGVMEWRDAAWSPQLVSDRAARS